MDKPYSTDGNALATSLICAALLEKLVASDMLTRDDVAGLLRNARNALGGGPVRAVGDLDAARLIDELIGRYTAQNV
jgi:hypothetical protein